MLEKFGVLVTDPIDPEGLRSLKDHPSIDLRFALGPTPQDLRRALDRAQAWLVRSETKVTREFILAAPKLRLIGRAGVGIDNIDLDAATLRGIAVINAPAANTTAACEHAFGLMIALARHIPQADADVKSGRWQRRKWIGSELQGKTLGLVGLGRIGREVARRAAAFGMRVLAHDPYVSAEQAAGLGVVLGELKTVLAESDFVSLHAPGTDSTRHLIAGEALSWMRHGARLVNCARGELVDEAALAEALRSGRLGGAALDVFEAEPLPAGSPLRGIENLLLTPHLGASTREAQSKVAVELARRVIEFCERGFAVDAVNLPGFDSQTLESLGALLGLAESLGRFAGQTLDSGLKEFRCLFQGSISAAQRRPLAVAALRGCLSTMLAQTVNAVNAPALAAERGIRVCESSDPMTLRGYQNLITVTAVTDKGAAAVSGTLLAEGEPRIVRLGELSVEVKPAGRLIVLTNRDTPGVIGRVGLLLGKSGVNIADMRVGRLAPRGQAVMVLTVDDELTPETRRKLEKLEGITSVRFVNL